MRPYQMNQAKTDLWFKFSRGEIHFQIFGHLLAPD